MTVDGNASADGNPEVDDLFELLAFATELADLADRISLPIFGGHFDVELKGDGTPVTIADRGVERTLRAAISTRYPDHAVLGEEDGLIGEPGTPLWIIDPIDGTKNFASGHPVWATLIALVIDDVEVIGIASAPALGDRWDAARGLGARHNGAAIAVSDVQTIDAGQISFGGINYFIDAGLGEGVLRLSAAAGRQRGFGDFWHHCLVASGVVEASLEAVVNRWDLAAVKCIVESAGGQFTDLHGVRTADGTHGACASNGHVHDEVLTLLRG